jgi:hypothetical protein
MSWLVYTLASPEYKLEAGLNLVGYIFRSNQKKPVPVVRCSGVLFYILRFRGQMLAWRPLQGSPDFWYVFT